MLQSSSSANFSYECALPCEVTFLSSYHHKAKETSNPHKNTRKPVIRAALRRSMGLDDLTGNLAKQSSSRRNTFSPEKSLTKIPESAVDALLDIDFTSPSSSNPAPAPQPKTAFLLADIFSTPSTETIDAESAAAGKSGENDSTRALPQLPLAKPIGAATITIQLKENLFMVEKANSITSFEVKGSVFAKANSPEAVKQSELKMTFDHAQHIHQVNDTTKKRSLAITKGDQAYEIKSAFHTDDSADIASATGLLLVDYATLPQFRPLPVRAKNKILHIGYSSDELQVVVQAALNPQFTGVFKAIKVQVSIAAIMNLIPVKDARMDPMGSFDKNKKIISWLHEDVTVSSAAPAPKLTFTATIPITEADKVHLTPEFMLTVLPMIFKAQLTAAVSGLSLAAKFSEKELVVSASTQIESRST